VGQFIGFLVDQLARHRFLQVASHLERKTTSSAYELLRLVEADLQAYTQITSGRIDGCVGLAVVGAEAHEHGAVDDRDTFLHRVRDLLSIHTCMI
jgi:HAUS augmin-like complex subunit 3